MLQAIQINNFGFSIQEGGEEEGIKLTVDGIQDRPLRLSPQQARTLACDLIQYAYRAETIQGLKKVRQSTAQEKYYEMRFK